MSRHRPSIAARLDALLHGPRGRAVAAALGDFLAVLAPSDCVACGAPDAVLCGPCRGRLRAATVRPVPAEDAAESLPLLADGTVLPATAAGRYADELAAVILAFKNRQRVGLAGVLGPALAGSVRTAWTRARDAAPHSPATSAVSAALGAVEAPLLLVPVPSRFAARTRRGYAPVEFLLQWIRRRGLLPPGAAVAPLLRHRPARPWRAAAQKGKGRRARAALRGSMRVSAGAAGRLRGSGAEGESGGGDTPGAPAGRPRCLVVDDVLTTGATIAEARRCLEEAGFEVAGAVVVAATKAPRNRNMVGGT
ncbi:ComF family protein [Zafaria sp. Z1313]|uniref:ComF family protein n=1 Tax=unclassified Zafaria TaxID=2828765 RepID=UPI002E7A8E61|nr:phosphoribosyltransferase family protein [Zafaria sp. J156]MEE1620313.1 phosphoribosyltransferase family protein [Zafaria sp. J156]